MCMNANFCDGKERIGVNFNKGTEESQGTAIIILFVVVCENSINEHRKEENSTVFGMVPTD
jgi:hypothetical protein